MCNAPIFPDPLNYEDYNGDAKLFLESVYAIFRGQFGRRVELSGLPVFYNKTEEDGYPRTFWHIISQDGSREREVDLRRAERISWCREMLALACHPEVLCWRSIKDKSERLHLWAPAYDYVVILGVNKTSFFLVTAITGLTEHRVDQFNKQWTEYQSTKIGGATPC